MRKSCLLAILIAALVPGAQRANAVSLEVVPTTIELPAKGGSTQLRLVNHDNEPADVQIETFAWTQDGVETLTDSDDVIVSPPFAHLKPLSSQIVRLLVASPQKEEGAFRVLVTQLPNPENKVTGTHVLLQFNVPMFVGGSGEESVSWLLRREGSTFRLSARNTGTRRAKYTNLELVAANGERKPVSAHALVYVLAGSTRTWDVTGLPAPSGMRLEGDDDAQRAHFSLPLTVD